MSKPPIVPDMTPSGIAVDPRTLERVIPESRRPDGSLRKQIKIRPGYTPQEDVRRFRGTRQAQMDATVLPKGHIIGWTPPSAAAVVPASKAGMSKAQKKNEKRKENRKKKRDEETVKENWDDEEEAEGEENGVEGVEKGKGAMKPDDVHTTEKLNWAVALDLKEKGKTKDPKEETDELADKLDQLEVR